MLGSLIIISKHAFSLKSDFLQVVFFDFESFHSDFKDLIF
jgi:hypothetical protein